MNAFPRRILSAAALAGLAAPLTALASAMPARAAAPSTTALVLNARAVTYQKVGASIQVWVNGKQLAHTMVNNTTAQRIVLPVQGTVKPSDLIEVAYVNDAGNRQFVLNSLTIGRTVLLPTQASYDVGTTRTDMTDARSVLSGRSVLQYNGALRWNVPKAPAPKPTPSPKPTPTTAPSSSPTSSPAPTSTPTATTTPSPTVTATPSAPASVPANVPTANANDPQGAALCSQMDAEIHQHDAASGASHLDTSAQAPAGFPQDAGSFFAGSSAQPGLTAVHRLFNTAHDDYVYLMPGNELNTAVARFGYVDQGVVFHAASAANGCAVPVYRLQKGGVHEYTTSSSQRDSLLASGWNEGDSQFWVSTKPAAAYATTYNDTNTYAYLNYKRATDAAQKQAYWQVASQQHTTWAMGNDNARIQGVIDNARAAHQAVQLTLYAIPGRDCGLYSKGGLADAAAYRTWVDQISAMVGDMKAMIVVEPDAISYCNNSRSLRAPLLAYVGSTFKANNPNAALYLHAGSGQLSQATALSALRDAGIENYRGFAMNVAGLGGTAREEQWAEQFVQTLANNGYANKHYIVDTSRSGIDSPANPAATYGSCNNFNAAIGPRPTWQTDAPNADAYLWVKSIGLSDGECGKGDPAAGVWYPSYVTSLVNNAFQVQSMSALALP